MKPIMLIILDGWGYREEREGNAISMASTPNWDEWWRTRPHTLVEVAGISVGLPEGTMGNSEVGHLNIGAGRIVYQEYTRINRVIDDRSFFENDILKDCMRVTVANSSTLHLMGLVSDAGVHSHMKHLFALIDMAKNEGVPRVAIHCFTDGRDTMPQDGIGYVRELEKRIADIPSVSIATVSGRYYAMDRDRRWDRTNKAFAALVNGEGIKVRSAIEAVETAYKKGETDEFIVPRVVVDSEGKSVAPIGGDDAVIFFNFRADRARQLTAALSKDDFADFERSHYPVCSRLVTMTLYDETFGLPIAFPPEHLENIFGEVISKKGLRQLRIAETEKYPHVTFFFNGGEETAFEGEDRCLIPSPRDVPTYDHKPQMSAPEVTEEVLKRIESDVYDVIVLNFANPDMVGHTGVFEAAVKAVETVDNCLGKIVNRVLSKGGALIVTADHGNCEQMKDESGGPHTAHTTKVTPLLLFEPKGGQIELKESGKLCDIAPTILRMLEIEKPSEMTGSSLIVE